MTAGQTASMTWAGFGTALWTTRAPARAPSALELPPRAFTHGHVKQLHSVACRLLPQLTAHPPLLPGTSRARLPGYRRHDPAYLRLCQEGAGYGYSKVRALNSLLAVLSAPLATPVITV
jgi:hypothetical protein